MSLTPQDRYRAHVVSGWTRIDMLLALYRRLLEVLDEGLATAPPTATQRMLAQRLVLGLLAGVDGSVTEPANSIRRLLTFVLANVQDAARDSWRAARKIVGTLHEGFDQIAADCRRMEREGQIPPLEPVGAMR